MKRDVDKSVVTIVILVLGLLMFSFSNENSDGAPQSRSSDQSIWILDSVFSYGPVHSFRTRFDTIVFSGLELDSISLKFYSNERFLCVKSDNIGITGANSFFSVEKNSTNIPVSGFYFCLNPKLMLFVTDFESIELYFKISDGIIPEFLNERI